MPDEQPKPEKKGFFSEFFRYWRDWAFYKIWNRTLGRLPIFGQYTPEARDEGRPAPFPVVTMFKTEFPLNNEMVSTLDKIETNWDELDKIVFPYRKEGDVESIKYNMPEPDTDTLTDAYRSIEYFRDVYFVVEQEKIFEERGTIKIESEVKEYSKEEIDKMKIDTENNIAEYERQIRELESRDVSSEEEKGILKMLKENLDLAKQFKERLERNEVKAFILPKLDYFMEEFPFINGEKERITALGVANMPKIRNSFEPLRAHIDQFASARGVPPHVRGQITQLMEFIFNERAGLLSIGKMEESYVNKLKKIKSELDIISTRATFAMGKRPREEWIRFNHTYKTIKPYRVVKTPEGKYKVEYFKDKYSDFKRDDEVEAGKDENGWPLEVFENPKGSRNWYVLLDQWWYELSQNRWHELTIKSKPGGKIKWKEKVTDGVKKDNGYGKVRKVPSEWVGNPNESLSYGIADVDALDKVMFIYNEWDSFRDDFRDGRYHLHSKTSMDYIIAGTRNITPTKSIDYNYKTTDEKTRIKFIPIYNHRGNIRSNISKSDIPEDERMVTRNYDLEVEGHEIPEKLRKKFRFPTPFDPAFDRVAIRKTFIHWGRMYYYETPEGITRWSENPFPHVTTRGIGKYLIDLTLRKTFNFSEARNILKSGDNIWDYGVRHYGKPFIKDPLGYARKGEGPMAGAK